MFFYFPRHCLRKYAHVEGGLKKTFGKFLVWTVTDRVTYIDIVIFCLNFGGASGTHICHRVGLKKDGGSSVYVSSARSS